MAPAQSRRPPPKKHALTLAQLASYDDILTDALIDHAHYWTTIPKNRPSYLPSRGVKEEEIAQIIQTHLAVTPDLQVAEDKLLATNGLGKFYRGLRTENEKEDFRRHLRRYMQIYLPDCPFEVASTNRYTIFQEEASICARRFIKANETIKYLCGIQVVITAEEEAQLSERKKDFSIVISSRKKEVNLFMGPARFANHDCDANARLQTTGQSGMEIIATKAIGVGDEITVTYGDSYFGEDNCECLCKTCENNVVNGWAPEEGAVPVKQSVEDDSLTTARGYSLRKRGEISTHRGHSETPSLTPIARPKVRRARQKNADRGVGSTPSLEASREPSHVGRKREAEGLATPPVTPAKRQKTTLALQLQDALPLIMRATSADSSVTEPAPIAQSVEVAQQDGETSDQLPGRMLTPESSQHLTDSESVSIEAEPGVSVSVSEASIDGTRQAAEIQVAASVPTPESSADSTDEDGIVCAVDNEAIEPCFDSQTRWGGGVQCGNDDNSNEVGANPGTEVEGTAANSKRRVPGDYTLTPLLLAEPETAWVFCTVCSKAFVQRDAYFTRMSCPRCERHSKLYGYMWPKTEPEGKWDKEERILDHRLVHRFLDPEDEAVSRGRKRPLAQSEGRAERRQPSHSTREGQASLGSGIWRKLKYMTPKEGPPKKAAKTKAAVVRPSGSGQVAAVIEVADVGDADGARRGGRPRKAGVKAAGA